MNSKLLVILATIIFTVVVILKFMTIQGMDASKENFYLYGVDGEQLFTISNEGNDTFVNIDDKKRVSIRGLFKKDGDYNSNRLERLRKELDENL